jgi:hypothetical protein
LPTCRRNDVSAEVYTWGPFLYFLLYPSDKRDHKDRGHRFHRGIRGTAASAPWRRFSPRFGSSHRLCPFLSIALTESLGSLVDGTMPSPDEYPIYVGVWTNWSRGAVMGATLTLSQTDSTLLIAFVAFFVAWGKDHPCSIFPSSDPNACAYQLTMVISVGTRVWRILCLILHFTYSSREPKDGLHHQRQIMLRNSANPESSLLTLAYIIWAWRRRASKPYLRLIVVTLLAVLCTVGFAAASGFSSQISAGIGNEVLLEGGNCAIRDRIALMTNKYPDRSDYFDPYLAKLFASAANYARNCYSNASPARSQALECGELVVPRLRITATRNARCPFDPKICKSQDANIILDTGVINSHEHLGVNAPTQDRFGYRQRLHCAVLKTEGYKSQYNQSTERSYTRYYYGRRWSSSGRLNYTNQVSNDAELDFKVLGTRGSKPDYGLT